MKWYQNFLVMFPVCTAFFSLATDTFYLWQRPRLNFEKNIRWGIIILYTSFLLARVLSIFITYVQTFDGTNDFIEFFGHKGKGWDIVLLSLLVFYSGVISFIQLKLVQLVYILPYKLRWKLIAAEAYAGIYAVISSIFFFLTIPNSNFENKASEIAYECSVCGVCLALAILSFVNARKLANTPETLIAIRLFQNELRDSSVMSSPEHNTSEIDAFVSVADHLGELNQQDDVVEVLRRNISTSSNNSLNQEFANEVAL